MQFLKSYLKISKHTIEKILYLLTNRHPSLELTHSCWISTLVHFLQKQDRFIVIIVFLLSVDSTTWNFMGPFIVSKPSLAVGHGICFTTWKKRFVISSIRFFSLVVECLVSCSSQNLLISSAHWMFLFGLRAYSTILLFTTPLFPLIRLFHALTQKSIHSSNIQALVKHQPNLEVHIPICIVIQHHHTIQSNIQCLFVGFQVTEKCPSDCSNWKIVMIDIIW